MTARNKNIPALRFKTDHGDQFPEWKETRLAELIEFRNGKGHEQFIDDKGKFIVVNSKFISTEGRVRKFCNTQISPLFKGEIVMVMSDIPNGKALAKCYLIDKDNHYTLNQRICALKQRNCSNEFLIYLVNRNEYYLGFDSGVGQTNLKKEEVINCPLVVPKSLSEQQKIASFLSAVDEKILQLTRKKELMEQYKKGVMQKLFSGKLRFKDEKGRAYPEWEEKRLGDVCVVNPKNNGLPDSFIYIDLESVEKGQLKRENRINREDAPSRAQRSMNKNDILYQTVRPYQMNNLFFDKPGEYVASTGYAQLRTNENARFIYQILHTDVFVNEVLDRCTGTSFPAIKSSDLAQIVIGIPQIYEQNKIATFLSSIDAKIEGIGNQINKSQMFKKGLLQQMFV